MSCPSATNCLAVGDISSTTVAERWNGKTWSTTPIATPAGTYDVGLFGVSCPSATVCIASGSVELTNSHGGLGVTKTLMERWNGKTWSITPSPNPSGDVDWTEGAVSCASPTNCFAVSDYTPDSNAHASSTLIEHWNGTNWSIMTSPNPAGWEASELYGVSCLSAPRCVAVGWYAGNGVGGLVERYR